VEAYAKVPVGIAVADEEPAAGEPLPHRCGDHGCEVRAEHGVRGRAAGVDFQVQPFGAGKEPPRNGGRRRGWLRLADLRRARREHDELVDEPALGTAGTQVTGTGEQLLEHGGLAALHQISRAVDHQLVVQIDDQLVVAIGDDDPTAAAAAARAAWRSPRPRGCGSRRSARASSPR